MCNEEDLNEQAPRANVGSGKWDCETEVVGGPFSFHLHDRCCEREQNADGSWQV